jgi:hypothetical protein
MILLSVLLVVCSTPGGAVVQSNPTQVASQFYRAYLKLKISGLPNDEQYKTLEPLLSSDLLKLLRAAKEKQEKFIKEHPDEKPPWIEGDLFTSSFEGAHNFRLGGATVRGDRARIPVHLEYRDSKNRVHWTDTIVLIRSGDEWRVWDILLNGQWEFKMGSSLRQILQAE